MGLIISRPSVFAWGPEACLSTVFCQFGGKARPLRMKTVFAVGSIKFKSNLRISKLEHPMIFLNWETPWIN